MREGHSAMNSETKTAEDRVAMVRARLADGRSISDFDVLHLLDEISRLRAENAALRADSARIVGQAVQGMNKVALAAYAEGVKNG